MDQIAGLPKAAGMKRGTLKANKPAENAESILKQIEKAKLNTLLSVKAA